MGAFFNGLPLQVAAGTRGSGSAMKMVIVSDKEKDPISPCFGFPSTSKESPPLFVASTPVPLTVFTTDKPPAGISSVSQWSEASRQLLEEEVRDSTSKLYNFHWEKFTSFCQGLGLQPIATGPHVVVDFLVMLAKNSKSKSLALMARVAISHCHL